MNRLERMEDFFAARVNGYDDHMRTSIEGSSEFYAYTASLLPKEPNSKVLDLGCGTGLELEEYYKLNPYTETTGIDLSEDMLNALKAKFPGKHLTLIHGSYFDVPLGDRIYDAAVSVESLHHFSAEMKMSLYKKLYASLKDHGIFVLTNYFAESEEREKEYSEELARIKREQELSGDTFYHYDTPLTVEHEKETLLAAGFTKVEELGDWESTHTLKAVK